MSIAPPPAYPTWPPQPYPPQQRRRRWPAIAASAGVGAIIAGVITTLVTMAATSGPTPTGTPAAAPTVTVTAAPPKPPPLPAAQADAKTCQGWAMADDLVTTAGTGLNVMPQNVTITDPAVQANPAWKAAVQRASQLYSQAADTLAAQIAPGTSPMLAEFADTTVSALRTLSVAYKTFDTTAGNVVDMFTAGRDVLDWSCGR